jgi:hypothetical protein
LAASSRASACVSPEEYERGIDPSGQAHHDVGEPVLLDVVTQSHQQRGIDLGDAGQRLGDRPPERRWTVGGRGRRDRREHRHPGMGTAIDGAVPGIAQTNATRGGGVDGRDDQLFAELLAPGQDAALVIDHERMAVEHELILPPDEIAEGDCGDVVTRTLDQHPFALGALTDVIRGGRDVDQQRGPGQRLVGGRWPRLPDVLADRQSDQGVAELDQRAAGARLEVALLVEDAVVGQKHLAVDRLDRAAGEHGAGVVDIVGALREADQRDDSPRCRRDPLQRCPRVSEKMLLEQQIFGRVAGDRQLREQDQLRPRLGRGVESGDDLAFVAQDVAHGRIELAEPYLQWTWHGFNYGTRAD